MDTMTKRPMGQITGSSIPGIEKLPTNFGGAKPIDAMGLAGLNPAMNRTPMGPLGQQSSAYMPSGSNFGPMSSKQDLVDVVAGQASADEKAKGDAVKRKEQMDLINKMMQASQASLFQGNDPGATFLHRRR